MSKDSTRRINDHFDDVISLPHNLYTIHTDKNEAIEDDQGGDVWVRFRTEMSFLDKLGQPSVKGEPRDYLERGVIIVEIFCAKGLGNLNLYGVDDIVTILSEVFVDERLLPVDSDEGIILFEDLSTGASFEQPSRSGRDYFRKDAFINYQKNYSK